MKHNEAFCSEYMRRGTAVSSKTRAHASPRLTVRGPLAVENASDI